MEEIREMSTSTTNVLNDFDTTDDKGNKKNTPIKKMRNNKRKEINIEYEAEDTNDTTTTTTSTTTTTNNNNDDKGKIIKSPYFKDTQEVEEDEKKQGKGEKKEEKKEEKKKTTPKITLAREHWQEVWKEVEKMRSKQEAPVDWAGCEVFGKNQDGVDEKVKRFNVLVACMLSSQTKDEVTDQAMRRLQKHGLNVQNIVKSDTTTLEDLIYPVSFYKRKADYLKRIAKILSDDYKNDIPPTFDTIIKLPGIGTKMTNLIVQVAWGRVEGIAVDVHVHRIANRLGWVSTKEPNDTALALQAWLPKDRWGTVNKLLVGFGQTVCTPTRPKCGQCLINHLCPVGIEFKSQQLKQKAKEEKENQESDNDEEEEEELRRKPNTKSNKKKKTSKTSK